eukprot:CAMPEP_0179322330 /NCGR_PEP_ID=MMETSP0797-20121207/59110_1 /TAXON_ID=47934 /ORGANISM="Dinophysis acuminata, Strain DAEP01" /LENGTH=43 /DNA_ID= /DNA_START= /DNA_END= /DNA_ORIENTATION=
MPMIDFARCGAAMLADVALRDPSSALCRSTAALAASSKEATAA